MNRNLVIVLLSVVLFLFACEQERDPCLQPTTVPLRIRAVKPVSDTTVTDSLLPHPLWIAIDSGRGVIFPENSSVFNILLSPLSDSCRYAVQPDSAVAARDTLVFYYSKHLQFLSNACGYTYFYTLLHIGSTHHLLDSVKINNDDVTSNANTPDHVQVFF